jgi:hypothetical protein
MKSHKIQRLEFISDKIDVGDCKRKVVRIRFGHPTKKTSLVRALHGRRPWPDFELHGRRLWGLIGEEERGRGGERGRARGCGEEEGREGGELGAVARGGRGLLLYVRKKAGKGREKRKEEGKEKMEKISKL